MKNKKGSLFITLGIILILAAVSLMGYNMYAETNAARLSDQLVQQLETHIPRQEENGADSETADGTAELYDDGEAKPAYMLDPNIEMPFVTVDGHDLIGMLKIPALSLELPVIKEWSYPNLNVAPSRYSGSVYTGDMVIAAHNYICHFAELKSLREGDRLSFTDMDGNLFVYSVVLTETLMPSAVEEMTGGEFDLTLFTCNDAGSARIAVRCNAVG